MDTVLAPVTYPLEKSESIYMPGDKVYARNYGAGNKWSPGYVTGTSGSRMVTVQTPDQVVQRHVDQVLDRQTATMTDQQPDSQDGRSTAPEPEPLRRSTRIRKPVDRYSP